MSVFKKPSEPQNLCFLIRGEPGSGKTRFGLAMKNVTGKTVALISNDRGAKFYRDDAALGGFLQVESTDVAEVDAAISELETDRGATFGAAVLDTISGLWQSEQAKFEKEGKDGLRAIPMRAWRPLRDQHEERLRRLQALPVHSVLICEEKAVYEKTGDELREIGTKEDSDKRDHYVCDVRLRFFIDRSRREPAFAAEVLKDRTGTFPMGAIVENPHPSMWVKGAAKPAQRVPPTVPPEANAAVAAAAVEEAAKKAHDGLVSRIKTIKNVHEMNSWAKKHAKEIKALPEPWQSEVVEAGARRRKEIAEQEAAATAGGAA